jgi:hypothetical protein
MKLPTINRDRLKVSRDVITFFLTIAIIFMAGFLGVLTGFDVLVKPKLEMTVSTTTSTTTSTIPVTTSTITTTSTTTSSTTIGTPCSPCFEYFNYRGHNSDSLSIKNGPRTVKITKVSQTKGGSMTVDANMEYVTPNQLMIFSGNFPEGTQINIEYVDITSGNARLDSATLH